MARKRTKKTNRRKSSSVRTTQKPTQALAIVALILNLLLPGLGTIIGGRTRVGIIQLVLVLVSIPLMPIIVGILLMTGVWIWALVTSIQLIQESS